MRGFFAFGFAPGASSGWQFDSSTDRTEPTRNDGAITHGAAAARATSRQTTCDRCHLQLIASRRGWQVRMTSLVKFVAGLVIAIVVIAPVLSAVSCWQTAQCMACCGSHCPMMSQAMATEAGSHTGRAVARTRCCSSSPHPLSLGILQTGSRNSPDEAVGHAVPVEAVLAFPRTVTRGSPRRGRSDTRRLQTVLCTFLL